MRIALTYNLKRTESEREAEFDSPATIRTLTRELAALGHAVTPIDVTGSIARLVTRLRRVAPDVVFNLAEGEHGPFREAFYPALFEQLGLRHTGSPASALALCLDKVIAKRIVAAAGVRVPDDRGRRVIVKPRFEGSSKGIAQASVTRDPAPLLASARYPMMVEAYVDGNDASVAWVDGLGFTAITYAYAPTGRHRILDFELKQAPDRVASRVVHDARLVDAAQRAFAALGVEGYGRADFRVTPDAVYFLEMNPIPSMAPADGELYEGRTIAATLAAIVGRDPLTRCA
jgi:D-alanine-D-alanine ligase